MSREKIVVLDFGSQYAHLIAKRFRMLGYYSEIALPSSDVKSFENVKGIVFSGGPSSVYDANTPEFNNDILSLDIPILGLCYGHYIVNLGYGGKAEKAAVGEFGFSSLNIDEKNPCPLFKGIEKTQQVWMSHQDEIVLPGKDFSIVGSTKDCKYAALQNLKEKRFSLQFHCEVKDTPCGNKIFENFADFCGMEKNWDQNTVLNVILNGIKEQVKDKNVLLFLSGGVDSTVAFALLNKALGQDKVLGLHIDNGFMRKNESLTVAELYHKFGFNNFIVEDASESFLTAIKGLVDPQKKRMAVGENFITVRNEVVASQNLNEENWLLAQGTLYPDIIESGGSKNANVIKTHHNRVAGIQALIEKGMIVEPLRDLYKDEVRNIGKKLGLSDELVMRHPFPGPGLSINVLCSSGKTETSVEEEFTKALDEIKLFNFEKMFESQRVLDQYVLPVRSVGVQGDFRTYRFPAVLSFREDENGFFEIPNNWKEIEKASSEITNKASFTNRTVVKLFQKPNTHLELQEGYCTRERLDQLREADNIILTELHKSGWYNKIFQHLTIDLPYASSKDRVSFVLRSVVSEDVMTARFAQLPKDLLSNIVTKIASLPFTDAIYFDATNKPPATFGWE